MAIIEIGKDGEFDSWALTGVVLVKFGMPSCAPCKVMDKVLDSIVATVHGSVTILKVDASSCPEVTKRFGIRSVPMTFLMKDGGIEDKWLGVVSESTLGSAISRAM